MTFDELEIALGVMLRAFKVDFKINHLIKSISVQYVVPRFGVVVVGFVSSEYKLVENSVNQAYPNHRKVYISHNDDPLVKKDDVFWALAKSGYIKWLRENYGRDFRNWLTVHEFNKKIVNKRLEIWAGRAMYKYLIEYNQSALNQTTNYVLSIDPSFYDYIPE